MEIHFHMKNIPGLPQTSETWPLSFCHFKVFFGGIATKKTSIFSKYFNDVVLTFCGMNALKCVKESLKILFLKAKLS